MVMALICCAACGHPGAHAAIIPAGAGYPKRCPSCPDCRAEAAASDQPGEPAAE
jgi:hypothetical protein